jgi:type IX secretion system PorP/SprF family membrane protein
MVISTDKYYIGGAVHHITEPDEGLLGSSKLPRKFTLHAGGNIPLHRNDKSTYLSPNILYMQQQDFHELLLGMYVKKDAIVGGLWYRNSDSFIILLGVEQGLVKIGYSYDVTISKLTNATAGSHELSLGLQLGCKPPPKRYRPVSCPSF